MSRNASPEKTNELEAACARLHSLTGRPKPAQVKEVDLALGSKWEGVQSAALQVLGRWGDAGSKRRLMTYLDAKVAVPRKSILRRIAIQALAPLIETSDAVWALNYYFKAREARQATGIELTLLKRLPLDKIAARVNDELRSDSTGRQSAAETLAWYAGLVRP